MSIRSLYACLFMLAAGWLVPVALEGQDLVGGGGPAVQTTPPGLGVETTRTQQPGDTLALAFEREVFTYPEYSRRNPFKTLLTADGGGPRFEGLLLLGILYSPFAGESVALFGEGTRTVTPAERGVAERVTVELTGGTYRVREGESVGNLTVRSIARDQVTIGIEEFGVTDTRTMILPRGTSGGGPR